MTKTTRSRNAPAAAPLAPADALAFNRAATDAYGRAWGACLAAWGQCGRELADFAATRLRKDTEFGESLLRCRTWSETAEVQREWVRATVDDYAHESGRFMEIWSAAADDPVARESREDTEADERPTD